MKKYYMSHIDFSEIINVTADVEQLDKAKERMAELGLITDKGNPAVSAISAMTLGTSKSFFIKLQKRLNRRPGGATAVKDTVKKLYERRDYYGVFMYIAFLYGFLEWQVPEKVMLLPAVPEALKCYCTEFVASFEKYLEENATESEELAEDGNQTDL